MCYTGLFKRIVPFVITFAAGLFLASFFVSIGLPTRRFERRFNRFQETQQLRRENDNLRERNRALQAENEQLKGRSFDMDHMIPDAVPSVGLGDRHPPKPPREPRRMRADTVQ